MKLKTTAILAVVFAGLLVFVLFFEKKPREAGAGPEAKLVSLAAADVEFVSLKQGPEILSFRKNDKGEWMIAEPMEAKADTVEVEALVSALADLRIERIVEAAGGDPKKYDIPQREISLRVKGQAEPVKILLGPENKLDATFYAQKVGDPRIVLLPSTLKTPLDKKLFDFRQKDVFRFEAKDVAAVKLRAKDSRWEARKTDGEWFFTSPLKVLARESQMTSLLESLAGLRAKEFAAEAKTPQELKARGLEVPEYTISLSLPAESRELVFSFHKAEDKTYATTSQSTKIIVPEADILFDLERKPADLRESKVAVFGAWQADQLMLKKGGLAITVHKAANANWFFDPAEKEEADGSKVETFLRKIEGLEAAEYIDAPKGPAEYGLDNPGAEIAIRTKDTASEKPVEKTVRLAVGKVDAEKKQAVVKNARFAWLVKADASFLDEFPKEKKDWAALPPAAPEKK
ncbi:MAG: DUF4340 domain-containing protein [Candidatus Aminicenantes bacterium]|nr:DUF4340 domain-containing protein [Candidatus Aminicenantes bacterium]